MKTNPGHKPTKGNTSTRREIQLNNRNTELLQKQTATYIETDYLIRLIKIGVFLKLMPQCGSNSHEWRVVSLAIIPHFSFLYSQP